MSMKTHLNLTADDDNRLGLLPVVRDVVLEPPDQDPREALRPALGVLVGALLGGVLWVVLGWLAGGCW